MVVLDRLQHGHELTSVLGSTATWTQRPADPVRNHLIDALIMAGYCNSESVDGVRERFVLTDLGRAWRRPKR